MSKAKPLSADDLLAGIAPPKKLSWFEKLSPEHQALVNDLTLKAVERGISAPQITQALEKHGIAKITPSTWNEWLRRRGQSR